MKWIAISGGWRKINKEVEENIRKKVREIMEKGDGIVSGGALGVDYIALDEALKLNSKVDRIKIFLPATLEIYTKHYRKRANEGVITKEQAESLIDQLISLKKANFNSLVENKINQIVDETVYHQRNTSIIDFADELIAFHINETVGTKDTIDKARQKGIPVQVFSYTIV